MKWFGRNYRHPKTTQERRASQERNDPLIRRKRAARNLPTVYDDIPIHREKSWKKKRKTQYRANDCDYNWHEFHYDRSWKNWRINPEARMIAYNMQDRLDELGCFWEYTSKGMRWFGPDLL